MECISKSVVYIHGRLQYLFPSSLVSQGRVLPSTHSAYLTCMRPSIVVNWIGLEALVKQNKQDFLPRHFVLSGGVPAFSCSDIDLFGAWRNCGLTELSTVQNQSSFKIRKKELHFSGVFKLLCLFLGGLSIQVPYILEWWLSQQTCNC